MKKIIVFSLVVLLFGCQKPKDQIAQTNKINFGIIDSIFSKTLNEQRKIWVYVPNNESASASSKTKYPVLYLLDGDAHFYSVAGLIHQLSTINGNTLCPEMIIVGIPNTDRTKDLTPTHVTKVFGDTTFSKTSGGGESFTKFISEELIPYIDQNYPTTSHRTLIGHSLGGLFAINTVVHHPELFSNYVAIDPSMWWDERKLTGQADSLLNLKRYEHKSLFIAIANTMKKGMKLPDLKNDTTEDTEHIRSIVELTERIKSKTNSGLTFESKYYAEDDHGSVPLIAEHDALRYLFGWYKLQGLDEYFNAKTKTTSSDLVNAINEHYKNVSDHFGYTVLPAETAVNSLAYGFMNNKMAEKAYALFDKVLR